MFSVGLKPKTSNAVCKLSCACSWMRIVKFDEIDYNIDQVLAEIRYTIGWQDYFIAPSLSLDGEVWKF